MRTPLIVIAAGLFCLSWHGRLISTPFDGTPAQDVQVISSGKDPGSPALNLKFVLELSITREGWNPEGLFIDENDNIYTFSFDALVKFDSQGAFVSERSFKTGQGPGEFRSKDPYFSKTGLLYIADSMQRRITVLNDRYETAGIFKINSLFDIFTVDSTDAWYMLAGSFSSRSRDRIRFALSKFSPTGELLFKITEYETGPRRDGQGVIHQSFYGPQLRYKIDSRDNVYYAMTDRYEIHMVSPDGKPLKIIQKDADPRALTNKEIEKYLPRNSPSGRVVTDIPESMPALADLFILDKGYLLVVTFENEDEKATLAGDVFDSDGRYRARVEVPKYHMWYWLFMPAKSNAIAKKNMFYTIESDSEETKFFIRRYRIMLTETPTVRDEGGNR